MHMALLGGLIWVCNVAVLARDVMIQVRLTRVIDALEMRQLAGSCWT